MYCRAPNLFPLWSRLDITLTRQGMMCVCQLEVLVSACRSYPSSRISTSIPLRLLPVDFGMECALVAMHSRYESAIKLSLLVLEVRLRGGSNERDAVRLFVGQLQVGQTVLCVNAGGG